MNWTAPIWSSSNGTNASAFAGNFSHYSAKQDDWQVLMGQNNCTRTASELNASRPCYIDTTNNKIWIRLPHFSGTSPQATINVSSTSQQAVFNIGDEKKFEVNDDDYYDLLIKLNSITPNSRANLTITYLHENVAGSSDSGQTTTPSETTNTTSNANVNQTAQTTETKDEGGNGWIIMIIVAIVIIAISISAYWI